METETIARTQDAIQARARASETLFGFAREVLVPYLDHDHAREFLKEGTTREEWESGDPACPLPADRATVAAEIADYMPFALEKATGHRGISAGRSVEKLQAWVWLLGDDDHDAIDWDDYPQYGAPILKAVCDRLDLTHESLEDERFQRMARGEPCRDDCMEGCGS